MTLRLQRQYIFIHDAMLEVIKMGNTEVSSQSLRRTLKQLQAQDPQTETSRLEEEYLVSHTHTHHYHLSLPTNFENTSYMQFLVERVK